MAVVYLVVRLHSLMDRTAVSGTAGTGSIPVGGASRSQTLRLAANSALAALRNLQRRGLLAPLLRLALIKQLAVQVFFSPHNLLLSGSLFLDFFDEFILLLRIFEDAVIVVAGAEDVYDHE